MASFSDAEKIVRTHKPHKPHKKRSDALPEGTPRSRTRKRRDYPFVAWDGEGYSINGKHYYTLFGNSLGARAVGSNLTFVECMPLLFESPREANHVIFAGTYDIVMMFRGVPQRQSLMKGQWTTVGRYRLRFLKGKMLMIKDSVTGQSRTLYDVFSFFGTSFVKACREYLDVNEQIDGVSIDTILNGVDEMKLQRAEFTELTNEIRDYMSTELVLLVKLCTALRDRLAAVNIHPIKWHGPGAVAGVVLRDQKVNAHRPTEPDPALVKAAESAYYGGRFEMMKRGTYVGDVYQYDIRSAYPFAMTQLPALNNMQWRHKTKCKVKYDYALYYIRTRNIGPRRVPFRNRIGSIYYPEWVHGWYWGIELPKGINATESWEPQPYLASMPFNFVRAMYVERAQLKKQGKPEQLALKLALNSLYGKLAQSRGANWNGKQWQKPTYHEPLWAGYITAVARKMIQDAVVLAGDDLIAVETDAVFTTKKLDLPIGENLGQWDETHYDGIKYIQSGVHMTLTDGKWAYKTRGVQMRRTASDTEMWDALLAQGSIRIRQVRFGTDWRTKTFGRWYTQERLLTLDNPDSLEKRINIGPCVDCDPNNVENYTNHLHRMIVPPMIYEPSTPYEFIWNEEVHPLIEDSDPTLYFEYLPEGVAV